MASADFLWSHLIDVTNCSVLEIKVSYFVFLLNFSWPAVVEVLHVAFVVSPVHLARTLHHHG